MGACHRPLLMQAKLLGVTATPIRGDGRGLGEHYQAMVQGPTAQQLTDDGFLAAAKVLAPPGFDSAGLRKRMGDFDTKQAEQRVGTIMGDCLGHYRKHLSGQTAIAFCCSVAHAEAVARLFNDNGVPAASIDGSMDTANRRQLLGDLAIGRIKVLTSCALIGEGVDVPSVGGCILLRPTASVGLHLQMIGRCLRPQPGKTAVVLDHVGNTLEVGPPPRGARLDARRLAQTRPRGSAIGQGMPPVLQPPASAPRRYAATAGMYSRHQNAGSCDRLRVNCRRSPWPSAASKAKQPTSKPSAN
jgi:superfamily II DNA or RNA helicase